ncbi:sigma-70 family RNA polymerase sigma factor [Micromonospora sp. NPDC050795]|uniref:sigma-70 family RNA polymerase sigma factor n=1 Tax=Micromonospora sp. NPDC050795 TaxID=3364282 RepID=UPI0037947972
MQGPFAGAGTFESPFFGLKRSVVTVVLAVQTAWLSMRARPAGGAFRASGREAVPAVSRPGESPPSDGTELEPDAAETLMREIVDQHRIPLHRFLTRLLLGQEELAEDLVQETLLRAWRNRRILAQDQARIAPWLYTVARNAAIDTMRARRVRPPEVSLPDLNRVAATGDEMDRVLNVHAVRTALAKISPEHRAVLRELYYRNASVAEAAARLGIPEGTVKSRAFYGMRSLHAAINSPHDADS